MFLFVRYLNCVTYLKKCLMPSMICDSCHVKELHFTQREAGVETVRLGPFVHRPSVQRLWLAVSGPRAFFLLYATHTQSYHMLGELIGQHVWSKARKNVSALRNLTGTSSRYHGLFFAYPCTFED
jgi:hypothetical protein